MRQGTDDREIVYAPALPQERGISTPSHPLELLVRNLELRSPLPPDDRQAVLGLSYTLRTLDRQTYTLREEEPPGPCAVLISGFAYRQKVAGNGSRQIIALHIPGDAMDFQNLFLDVSDHSIQMLTNGDVAFVSRTELQHLARSRPLVAHAILVKILVEASIFREWVLNVGRRDARTKVAHLLCELAIRLDREGTVSYNYELPMTQEQLADAVGLTPVHVNRTLRRLEADGLITRTNRSVSFPNWKEMLSAADFNQRYLHLERQWSGLA